jgi:hypothetical protein
VDNTPPRIESLNARVEGKDVQVSFRAVDNYSPIRRAEYSIDADDWQLAAPVGQISDYKIENYDFKAPIPTSNSAGHNAKSETSSGTRVVATEGEHTIVVRAYDRFENMGIAKIVVKAPTQ